ncbi:alpha/beta hydrolase [Qipengyuania sp. GH1]|nr:alpha/beta hydrolase [Qipengyuania aestuarii]
MLAPYRRPVLTSRKGAGRAVLVLPGMASGDRSTGLLRHSLAEADYRPVTGDLGRNLTVSPEKFAALESRLCDIAMGSDRKPVLIGWSLGGFYARVLAQRHPDKVAMVATMGTPFSGSRRANNAWRLYEFLADHSVDDPPLPDDPARKPPVYTIAFWSAIDGIVAPASARGRETERDEAIELSVRHFEMGCSRTAVRTVIETVNSRLERLEQ